MTATTTTPAPTPYLGQLTSAQHDSLLSARGALVDVKDAEARLDSAQAFLARLVFDATQSGVSNTTVAKALGISETSVRRMRKVVESRS